MPNAIVLEQKQQIVANLKADIEGATVSVSCENLFTLAKRQGLNPQQTFNGTQSNSLVTPRVFSVGLNIKF